MPFTTLFHHGLLYGAILSVALGVITMGSLSWDAEMWLRDYPADIIAAHGPMGARARKRKRWVGGLWLGAWLAILVTAIVTLHGLGAGRPTFWEVALLVLIMNTMFNLVDLLILDWLILMWMRPAWAILPGTEGCAGYKDALFHLRAAAKGVMFSVVVALVVAMVTVVLRTLLG